MRKILFFILAIAALLLTGCNKGASTEATTHAIAGHSFRMSIDDTHWEIISFAVNGTAACTSRVGETENTIEHLTYIVHGAIKLWRADKSAKHVALALFSLLAINQNRKYGKITL